MNMRHTLLICVAIGAFCLMASPVAVQADEARIIVPANVFEVLQQAQATSLPKNVTQAEQIRAAILEDGRVDEGETRFVTAILAGEAQIAVFTEKEQAPASCDGACAPAHSLIFIPDWRQGEAYQDQVRLKNTLSPLKRAGEMALPVFELPGYLFDAVRLASFESTRAFVAAFTITNALTHEVEDAPVQIELLQKLLGDAPTLIFHTPSTPTHLVFFDNEWESTAQRILREQAVKQKYLLNVNLRDLWEDGVDDVILRYLPQFKASSAEAEQVTVFLAQKATELWAESNMENQFLPLRSFISKSFTAIMTLPEPDKNTGRLMLYDSVKQADTLPDGTNGAIPDVLYNWVKPKDAE